MYSKCNNKQRDIQSISPVKFHLVNADTSSCKSRLDNAVILEEENRLLLETTKVFIDYRNVS